MKKMTQSVKLEKFEHKENYIESSNTFSKHILTRFSYYSQHCKKEAWLHNKEAYYYNRVDTQITIGSAMIGILSTVAITSLNTLFESNNRTAFYVLNGIAIGFNLLCSLLNAYKYANNNTLKILQHTDKASKYNHLHRKIQNQMSLPEHRRVNYKVFLDHISEIYSELEREKPFIRECSIEQYVDNPSQESDWTFIEEEKQPQSIIEPQKEGHITSYDLKKLDKILH